MAPFLFIHNSRIVSSIWIIRCHFCHEKEEKEHFLFLFLLMLFLYYICIALVSFILLRVKKISIIPFLKWFRSLHHSASEYICTFSLFTLFSRIESHWNANAITAFSIHLKCIVSFLWFIKMCSRVNCTRVVENDTTKKCEEKEWNNEVFFYNRRDYTATIFTKRMRIIISGMTCAASCEFCEPITSDWVTATNNYEGWRMLMNAPLCVAIATCHIIRQFGAQKYPFKQLNSSERKKQFV